jgi:hypothetical protein
MGNTVHLLETRAEEPAVELRALLPAPAEAQVPVLFLLSSLAFLEAQPLPIEQEELDLVETFEDEYSEADGWTPADFLSHLRFDGGALRLNLGCVRGRGVFTELSLTPEGELRIRTLGRGNSATRWLSYVRGRSHIQPVS